MVKQCTLAFNKGMALLVPVMVVLALSVAGVTVIGKLYVRQSVLHNRSLAYQQAALEVSNRLAVAQLSLEAMLLEPGSSFESISTQFPLTEIASGNDLVLHLTTLSAASEVAPLGVAHRAEQQYLLSPFLHAVPASALTAHAAFPLHPALNVRLYNDEGAPIFSQSLDAPLYHHFGMNADELVNAARYMGRLVTQCSELNEFSHGLYLLTQHCEFHRHVQIGSPASPVLLIINNSDFTLSGASALYGLVVTVNSSEITDTHMRISTDSSVIGGIISSHRMSARSHIVARLDQNIMRALQRAPALQRVTPVTGSWHDF